MFPAKTNNGDKTNSVVIVNKKQQKDSQPQKETKQKETTQNETTNNSAASWIRKAMPTSNDPMSPYNSILSGGFKALGEAISIEQNANTTPASDANENIEIPDDVDLYELNKSTANVAKLSNASDDEGQGSPLRTFFEKDIKKGFSTNNYAGTKFEKNINEKTSEQVLTCYSDNLYSNGKTSIIFGGTANVSYKSYEQNKSDVDYNAYAFWKQKGSKFTYGLGGLANGNNSVSNIHINLGVMHNSTNIYAILQKDLTVIPGLPTHSQTNIDVGIGKASGLLDPNEYNKKDKSLEEIDKIDSAANYIDGQRNRDYETDEKGVGLDNAALGLIVSNTDEHKEYGIKGGYIFRHISKKNDNNYAFVMPFGAISNINVNSKEGAKFVVGAHAGQNITFGNGWQIRTKALLEGSIGVLAGSSPNNFVIANAHLEAYKNKFSGQLSLGTYFDNAKKFCRYAEAGINYEINKRLSANIKAGIADYKFSNEEGKNNIFQLVAGVKYAF